MSYELSTQRVTLHAMAKHTVIFCGTPAFAVPSLESLAADPDFDVRLVVTQPDKPVGRQKTLTAPPVKTSALRLNLRVIQPDDINDPEIRLQLAAIDCDFLVVVAYGKILSQEILALPHIAPVNVHGSILPRWRGASPVEHAILAGDKETGVTVQIMAEALDAGPVLSIARTDITARETTPQLKEKLCHMGASLLVRTLKEPLRPAPQPDTGVTYCRKLARKDGTADPRSMTAKTIDRMVRALNPWPGVTCTVEGQELKLIETSLEPVEGSIPFPCAQSTILHLASVQAAGKKPMTGQEWKRGLKA